MMRQLVFAIVRDRSLFMERGRGHGKIFGGGGGQGYFTLVRRGGLLKKLVGGGGSSF